VTQFIELLINGISLGFTYALLALGFVIIFKSTRVINFAHGSVVLLGAYLIATLADDVGFLAAVAIGLAASAAVAALLYLVVLITYAGAPRTR